LKPQVFGYRAGGGIIHAIKNIYFDTFGFDIFINLGLITGAFILLTMSIVETPFPINRTLNADKK